MLVYLGNLAAPYTPATIRGAWDKTAGAVTQALMRTRTGGAITSIQIGETDAAANFDVLLYRGVSEALAAQTISGTLDVMLGVDESSASADFAYHLHLYVTQGDSDTPRGTLLSDYVEAVGQEWPTTAAGKALASAQALSSLAVQDGDRLVIEIGYVALNASATSFNGRLRYGDASGVLLTAGDTTVTTHTGYLNFSATLTWLDNAAPSGLRRFDSGGFNDGIVTGTTSITFTQPSGMEENDLMLVWLSHKGVGFATPPSGWTLIVQEVDGVSGVRGEAYWKRAGAEAASYVFSGLATAAVGDLRVLRGALRSGNPIDTFTSRVNAAGASGTGPITTTQPNVAIYAASMVGSTALHAISGGDVDLLDLNGLSLIDQLARAAGSGASLSVGVGVKPVAGLTTDFTAGSPPAVGNIGIVIAILPETDATGQSRTRYYLTQKPPSSRNWIDPEPVGTWDYRFAAPATPGIPGALDTFELSQQAHRAGLLSSHGISTDQPGARILHTRWVTPRLEAQTISGTIDVMQLLAGSMDDSAHFPLDSFKVQTKLHVYISVGDTPAVRATLLDNYVDGVDWTTTVTWTRLATPQTLATAACQAGDRIVIEYGIYVRVLPTVPPAYPPDLWGFAARLYLGSQFPTASGVAYQDGKAGTTNLFAAPYIDFSIALVEQAGPAAPSNTTYSTARVVASVPYADGPHDISGAEVTARQTWYKWTAPETKRVILYTLGSNFLARIGIFDDPSVSLNPSLDVVILDGGCSWGRCDYVALLDAQAGKDYYIRISHGQEDTALARPNGGVVQFGMSWYSAPQENDLFVPAANVYVIRDGVIVNVTPLWRDFATTGIAIDFSGVALPDFNSPNWPTPDNTNPKVYLGTFGNGLVEILDGISLNPAGPEVNFILDSIDPFNATPPDTGPDGIATLDITNGRLLMGWFGNGFHWVNGSSTLQLAAYMNDVSSDVWTSAIREQSAYGVDNTGEPFATPLIADVEKCAPWHIRVNPSNPDEIYYTSGGFYADETLINSVLTSHRAQLIKRYSRSGGQLADFATVPLASCAHEGLYGIDIHPNGDVIVCNGNRVDRLNSSGVVVQSYTPSDPLKSTVMIAVRYTSDGTKFWAFDQGTATLWQFRVSDGAELQQVELYMWSHVTTQMAIWLPSGIVPPQPAGGCVDTIGPGADSGGGTGCAATLSPGEDWAA